MTDALNEGVLFGMVGIYIALHWTWGHLVDPVLYLHD